MEYARLARRGTKRRPKSIAPLSLLAAEQVYHSYPAYYHCKKRLEKKKDRERADKINFILITSHPSHSTLWSLTTSPPLPYCCHTIHESRPAISWLYGEFRFFFWPFSFDYINLSLKRVPTNWREETYFRSSNQTQETSRLLGEDRRLGFAKKKKQNRSHSAYIFRFD